MAKPVVDRIETELDGRARVVRLDVMSSVGREAAARYGVRGVPSLVVVDGQGEITFGKYGIPVPSTVIAEVDKALALAN